MCEPLVEALDCGGSGPEHTGREDMKGKGSFLCGDVDYTGTIILLDLAALELVFDPGNQTTCLLSVLPLWPNHQPQVQSRKTRS